MSSFKDTLMSRPPSQHRTSAGTIPSSSIAIRHSGSRQHSHTLSLGANSSSHRVTRRKSMTSGASNTAAVLLAALNGSGDHLPASLGQMNRQSLPVKHVGSTRAAHSISSDFGGQGPSSAILMDTSTDDTAACEHGPVKEGSAAAASLLPPGYEVQAFKARVRRASEGAHHGKGEGKRASGELRCEQCGKGYKHSSCLTKHLWEHTPEWSYTSKLLISKHQQVQLLEAASVLVGMNQDASEAPESAKLNDSDHSSASPPASGTSEVQDDYLSSAETTPPPTSDHFYAPDNYGTIREKRHSGNSSSFSRSYQSALSMPVGSAPSVGPAFGSYHSFSNQRRPSTSGAGVPRTLGGDEEEAGLAAAVESLCSFGTPQSGAVHLPSDIPPVPPLPARYVGKNVNRLSGNLTSSTQPALTMLPSSTQRVSNERGPLTKERNTVNAVVDEDHGDQVEPRSKDDDEDELMFGRDEFIY